MAWFWCEYGLYVLDLQLEARVFKWEEWSKVADAKSSSVPQLGAYSRQVLLAELSYACSLVVRSLMKFIAEKSRGKWLFESLRLER